MKLAQSFDFSYNIDHIPIYVLKFYSWVKKPFFSILQFSFPNLIVIHLIECDSGPPANHDPLPDNIQGNCLLTPPTFHPINADNGFHNFTWYFFPYFSQSYFAVLFCPYYWSKIFEVRHVSPIKLPQGRDRQSSSIRDLG